MFNILFSPLKMINLKKSFTFFSREYFFSKNKIVLLLLISITTFIAFSPVLLNNFISYDDPSLVLDNKNIQRLSISQTKELLISHFTGHEKRFRPLIDIMFSIEYYFFHHHAVGYHLISLLFHIGTTLLVFLFADQLTKNLRLAFFSSLLFGIHPIHVEAVAWISAQAHVIFPFFYFLGLLLYAKIIDAKTSARSFHFGSFLAFFLSLLSFSGALTFPFACLLVDLYQKKQITKKDWIGKIHFFTLSLLFVWLTIFCFNQTRLSIGGYMTSQTYSLYERIHLTSLQVLTYWMAILFPFGMSPINPTSCYFNNFNALASIVLLLIMLLFFIIRKKDKIIAWGILFFFITCLPFFQIYSTSDCLADDRYVYIPSFGIFLILAVLIERLCQVKLSKHRSGLGLKIIFSIYLITLTALSWSKIGIWRNSGTFWTSVINRYAQATPAYLDRGEYCFLQGKLDDALFDLNRYISDIQDKEKAYLLRGIVYFLKNSPGKAIDDFSRCLAIKPDHIDAYLNRGLSFFSQEQYQSALNDYEKVLSIEPQNVLAQEMKQKILSSVRNTTDKKMP